MGRATDYEIASNIIFPSYVSMQAGMQYYGLIDQNIIRFSVITPERHSELRVRGISIEFIHARRSLFFGYERKGNEYIAKAEKLFIDSLYFSKIPEWMVNEAFKSAKRHK